MKNFEGKHPKPWNLLRSQLKGITSQNSVIQIGWIVCAQYMINDQFDWRRQKSFHVATNVQQGARLGSKFILTQEV